MVCSSTGLDHSSVRRDQETNKQMAERPEWSSGTDFVSSAVCVCVRVCVRACVRACVRVCV